MTYVNKVCYERSGLTYNRRCDAKKTYNRTKVHRYAKVDDGPPIACEKKLKNALRL